MSGVDVMKETGSPITAQLGAAPGDLIHVGQAPDARRASRSTMTIEGVFENGRIKPRDGVALPEHTKVYVVIPDVEATPSAAAYRPRLARPEQARDFVKQVIEVQTDAEL